MFQNLANKLIEKGYNVKIISCENTIYIPISKLKIQVIQYFHCLKQLVENMILYMLIIFLQ